MEISAEERRQAFSAWLRTGRWPGVHSIDGVQLKFNPWHDPEDGRFTFAGTGRYYGRGSGGGFTGGGGGRFGGGGATGTWGPPDTHPKPQAPRRKDPQPARRLEPPAPAAIAVTVAPAPAREQPASQPFRRVVRNGYEYQIDAANRTRHVSGHLTLNDIQPRSRTAQARAGGSDRCTTDDGGHYIARRFHGPAEAFNHFAQDANFNRGAYRALEDEWARAKRNGKQVFVKIVPTYDGKSQRPAVIDVWYTIDGNEIEANFPNARREKPLGQR